MIFVFISKRYKDIYFFKAQEGIVETKDVVAGDSAS